MLRWKEGDTVKGVVGKEREIKERNFSGGRQVWAAVSNPEVRNQFGNPYFKYKLYQH